MIKKRKHRKPARRRKAVKPLPPPPPAAPPPPLSPDQIVRMKDGPIYFGMKRTQLDVFIARGEIDAPLYLSDTGRVRGWLGSTILEWQRLRAEKTAARLADARAKKERGRTILEEKVKMTP